MDLIWELRLFFGTRFRTCSVWLSVTYHFSRVVPEISKSRRPFTFYEALQRQVRTMCQMMCSKTLKFRRESSCTPRSTAMSLPWRPPIPVSALQLFCLAPIPVGLRRGHIDTFEIATLHKNKIFDEIHCVAEDQGSKHSSGWVSPFWT